VTGVEKKSYAPSTTRIVEHRMTTLPDEAPICMVE
jgi:hypothetical protein